jgi:hypothetical protein
MEYLVLYIAPKEKIQLGYVGAAKGPRDWSVSPNPFEKILLRLSLTVRPQCEGVICETALE